MATKTVLTLEQFMALPEREEDGTHYELSEGELIKLPPPGSLHALVVGNITILLGGLLSGGDYLVLAGDAGFLLRDDAGIATVRGADIAVIHRKVIPAGWIQGGPVVAVEVVSAGNKASDMQLKVKQYLKAGSLEVWLVYPETQTVYVYSAGRRAPQVYAEKDEFQSVVGQTFRVADFFRI